MTELANSKGLFRVIGNQLLLRQTCISHSLLVEGGMV